MQVHDTMKHDLGTVEDTIFGVESLIGGVCV